MPFFPDFLSAVEEAKLLSGFPAQFMLTGKTALVTGASRGIGRAVALGCAEAGADVALLARSTSRLEDVADEVERFGRRALVLTCDVCDPVQVERAVESVVDAFGRLDVLVNNAGGFDHAGPALELTSEDWTEVLRVNLETVLHVSRLAGACLVAQGHGAVVNVASIAGLAGVPMLGPYALAKAGVISLTRTFAAEWASAGVRVNALAPGWVRTDLTRTFVEEPKAAAGLLAAVPAGRFADPADVVGPAVFLASDAARMVTGAVLTADGGTTCYAGGPAMREFLALGRVAV